MKSKRNTEEGKWKSSSAKRRHENQRNNRNGHGIEGVSIRKNHLAGSRNVVMKHRPKMATAWREIKMKKIKRKSSIENGNRRNRESEIIEAAIRNRKPTSAKKESRRKCYRNHREEKREKPRSIGIKIPHNQRRQRGGVANRNIRK